MKNFVDILDKIVSTMLVKIHARYWVWIYGMMLFFQCLAIYVYYKILKEGYFLWNQWISFSEFRKTLILVTIVVLCVFSCMCVWIDVMASRLFSKEEGNEDLKEEQITTLKFLLKSLGLSFLSRNFNQGIFKALEVLFTIVDIVVAIIHFFVHTGIQSIWWVFFVPFEIVIGSMCFFFLCLGMFSPRPTQINDEAFPSQSNFQKFRDKFAMAFAITRASMDTTNYVWSSKKDRLALHYGIPGGHLTVMCFGCYFSFFLVACAIVLFYDFIVPLTDESQMKGWCESIKRQKQGEILRWIVLVGSPAPSHRYTCVEAVSNQGLGLRFKDLRTLHGKGLPIYLVRVSLWWPGVIGNLVMMSFRQSIRESTIFVSHRWGPDGTWYGENGWQLEEVLTFCDAKAAPPNPRHKVKYFWIDGLCAPQEKEYTMAVINRLRDILHLTERIVSIDGFHRIQSPHSQPVTSIEQTDVADIENASVNNSTANNYVRRVWCLYELLLGSHCSRAVIGPQFSLPKQSSRFFIADEFITALFHSAATEPNDKYGIILNALRLRKRSTSDVLSFYRHKISIYDIPSIEEILASNIAVLHLRNLVSEPPHSQGKKDSDMVRSGFILNEACKLMRSRNFLIFQSRKFSFQELLDSLLVTKVRIANSSERKKSGGEKASLVAQLTICKFDLSILANIFWEKGSEKLIISYQVQTESENYDLNFEEKGRYIDDHCEEWFHFYFQ